MSWNLNRALVVAGGIIVVLGMFVATAFDLAATFGPMGLPFMLGIVAAIVLAFYAPAWMYLVGGILVAAFPLVVLFVFGAYNGIIHPGSGFEGYGLLLILLGALLGLLGGIAGFVQARRNAQPPLASLGRAPQGMATLLIVALIAGLALSAAWANRDYRQLAELPASHIESPDATVELFASGTQFAPRALSMSADALTLLAIENRDKIVHTFSYDLGGKVHTAVLPPGTTSHLAFKWDSPQTIHYFCEPHSSGPEDTAEASMWGTLTIG